jgi:hypothetical protein
VCDEWVELIMQRMEIGREGGTGVERRPSSTIEMCPNDDGASGHVLIDAPPD